MNNVLRNYKLGGLGATADLRFQAGDSVAEIAMDFSVPPDEVEDVIRLATRTAA